jgi:hypothetical protein
MGINVVPVRATVNIGGQDVRTPYVLSFTVRRTRGQIGTFDASLKVSSNSFSGYAGSGITISAGLAGSEKKIFTGIVTNAKIEACHDDPGFMILSISGKDALMFLEGKKFTRRCRATQGAFCLITSVSRSGLKSGKWSEDIGVITTDSGQTKTPNTTGTVVASFPGGAKSNDTGVNPPIRLKATINSGEV